MGLLAAGRQGHHAKLSGALQYQQPLAAVIITTTSTNININMPVSCV